MGRPAKFGSGAARREIPMVSVLVPIYNVEGYLEQCLASIADQTLSDFEVICINDGSTDGSRAIIQRFLDADPRFRVVDKPNSGYGASMNRGLGAARGTYVAILESDDFFEPDALETLVSCAEQNASEVVKADFWLYWTLPERRELFGVVDDVQAGRTMRPLDDMAVFFRKPSIWSALYRHDFLETNDIRFLETPGASYQDAGFSFKVWASAQRVSFLAKPVVFYRQDNESSSVNSKAKAFCICDEYASMAAFLDGCPAACRHRLQGILERMKFDSYLWNIDRLEGGLRAEFAARASAEFAEDLAADKVDLGLFEPGAAADLRALVTDADRFVSTRDAYVGRGVRGSLKHYLSLGGVPLVARVIWHKLFGRSVRRTNERGGTA